MDTSADEDSIRAKKANQRRYMHACKPKTKTKPIGQTVDYSSSARAPTRRVTKRLFPSAAKNRVLKRRGARRNAGDDMRGVERIVSMGMQGEEQTLDDEAETEA